MKRVLRCQRRPRPLGISRDHISPASCGLLPELLALYAPNINSYKRFVTGSWAPTVAAWGIETRTPSLRVITGSAKSTHLRTGCRARTSTLSGDGGGARCGLLRHRARHGAPPPMSATPISCPRRSRRACRAVLDASIARFADSEIARQWFGDEFVRTTSTMRRWEIERYRRPSLNGSGIVTLR